MRGFQSDWRYYNGRADCENVIKELQAGFALPTLCLEQFWATEAALKSGQPDLQPDRALRAASGLAAKSDVAQLAVLAVRDRRRVGSSGGQNHPQTGRAETRTRMVAAIMGKSIEPVSQLQCSRKPTRVQPPILMKIQF